MTSTPTVAHDSARNQLVAILAPIDRVAPSGQNPRRAFDEAALDELAASIREHGILQPLLVRPHPPTADGQLLWEIVAGERRWRAAQRAGLTHVPVCSAGDLDDTAVLRLALVENLQRADLNPIEEAEGYTRLHHELGLRQRQTAKMVQKAQPTVANRMRLLDLPEEVRERIRKGELTAAHGIALASMSAFPELVAWLAARAVEDNLSTHQLESGATESYYYDLSKARLVQRIQDYGMAFDAAVCRMSCPFGAYRASRAPGSYGGYCLKPTHYDELQAVAEAKAQADLKALGEAQRGNGAAQDTMIELSSLRYDTYEQLDRHNTPDGCDKHCPCRAHARGYNGDVVQICTDPTHLQRLRAATTRAKKKARRAEATALLAKVVSRVDALTEVGPRELAVLAHRVIWSLGAERGIRDAARHVPSMDTAKLTRYDQAPAAREALAGFTPLAVVRFTVEALCRASIEQLLTSDGHQRPVVAEWYLGEPLGGGPATGD